MWVVLRVHILYISIGPCNLSPKAKHRGTVFKPIILMYSTIFVLPGLGTDQGMSTKMGDQKIYEYLHKLT